ncbi:linear amide C-N hydrolase [Martelella limonii]|uniref:linear amide C-N hydrolase n=1 Tax=Martelella limonii TaxID=1647649 RepID=UPI0015810710|nr:linear amide C-N hydrolase [Martelella limonii]
MCTRIFYETGTGTYLTGRSMDWQDLTMQSDLWVFPRGFSRNGGVGAGSAEWTSKYGSVIVAIYNLATSDGLNEAGLAGNMLYLVESTYGDPQARDKPLISVGAWLQYMLDNFATVAEAVAAMEGDPLTIVTGDAPNGAPANVHLALSDPSGDSAIFEFVDGALHIHHSRDYRVMTNSPTFDQQLAINAYWDLVGGRSFLPGTVKAADRFARASYNLKSATPQKDRRAALASVFSQVRAISSPLGMSDPEKPNIASTLWRTVAEHDHRRYYFDSVINPSVFWVELADFDLSEGAPAKRLGLGDPDIPGGDVSGLMEEAEAFEFLVP